MWSNTQVIPQSERVKIVTEHPSRKLPTEKRARLYQVASHEFATHGFSQASLNRIIASVGMSKSSFYHYYANKNDLFRQTLEQTLAPVLAAWDGFDPGRLDAATFWPSIQQLAQQMAQTAIRSPDLVVVGRMFYRSRNNPDEGGLTQEITAASAGWLGELIGRGQVLGLIRNDLPDGFVIETVMALGMSIDRWMLAHWEELTDQQRLTLSGKAFDLFLRVLQPA